MTSQRVGQQQESSLVAEPTNSVSASLSDWSVAMGSGFDTKKFIQVVRSKPPLWDKLDPKRRATNTTNFLWNTVAQEMGGNLTANDLKQKWHNLRDCFRREVRDQLRGKKKREWIYYQDMLFLIDQRMIKTPEKEVGDANANNNILLQPKNYSIKETSQNGLGILNSDQGEVLDIQNTAEENTIKTEEETKYEKRIRLDKYIQTEEIENTLIPDAQETRENIEQQSECSRYCRLQNELPKTHLTPGAEEFNKNSGIPTDDDYHFALSIIPHMRQVPIHRKLRMRIRISEAIAEELSFDGTQS